MVHSIIVDKPNIPSVLADLKKQGFEPDCQVTQSPLGDELVPDSEESRR
jgi:hypothetical protein